jgi:HJR/Mrr/RecB family endonuclease
VSGVFVELIEYIVEVTSAMDNSIVPEELVPGELYTNDQIFRWFGVANSGGIRPSIGKDGKLDFIVLMTTRESANYKFVNPYHDKIEDGILVYTGAGSTGDQTLSGVNKRIVEQNDRSVPIIFFIKEARGAIRFIGYLLLLRNFEDYQLDSYRSVRKVQIFEFKIIDRIPVVRRESFRQIFTEHYADFSSKADQNERQIAPVLGAELDTQSIVEKEVLRNKLLSVEPYDFEEMMAALIAHSGFYKVTVTKKSGDGGVDIKANLGHHFSPEIEFLFQVKRWRHSVGRIEVANLRGSIGYNNFGVMVSTGHFTKSAIAEASADEKKPINLVGIDALHTIIKQTGFSLPN